MKRFPNGVARQPFYQHRAPDVPAGVRTEVVSVVETAAADHRRRAEDAALHDAARRDLAGSVVLARRSIRNSPTTRRSISTRPRACRSRACSTSRAGFATSSTRSAPRRAEDIRRRRPAHLHPAAAGTPYEAGLLFCQIVATVVAQKHPKVATIERSVAGARQARVHRLPAEHPRQDARDRLQRARERLRRRVDAARPGRRSTTGSIAATFTIETVPARLDEGGRPVGGAAEVERRRPDAR